MDNRNFHQKFVDSLAKRDWQLGALIAVPLAGFLLAETVGALLPERPFEERCAHETRVHVTERMFGALVFDIGRPEITGREAGMVTVEIDLEANGIPLRAAYLCSAGAASDLILQRLWSRRV